MTDVCSAADHWRVALIHELPDGGLVIRSWRVCPSAETEKWLAATAAELGEPLEERILTAEETAMHRAAHAGDPAIGTVLD
jgi:hypothetical protein